MNSSAVFPVQKIRDNELKNTNDYLAVEEPLEIKISFQNDQKRSVTQTISVTMRTPSQGQDKELAAGFLMTEGIIHSKHDIKNVDQTAEHLIQVELKENIRPDLKKLERNFYTTSSCGVCGKTSIEAVKVLLKPHSQNSKQFLLSPKIIYSLPETLNKHQETFAATGGLHASALFNVTGKLISLREDVGRHNALDKLIGAAMFNDLLPLNDCILLLSGRASFELIQKAAMAEITFVCAIGAPSSLAVELATDNSMTLIGFLRNKTFNIYCGQERINLSEKLEVTLDQ